MLPNLPAQIVQAVNEGRQTLVLLLDQAERLAKSCEGHRFLRGLKASRDMTNLRPGTVHKFILVAAGASPELIGGLVADATQAFYGATMLDLATEPSLR